MPLSSEQMYASWQGVVGDSCCEKLLLRSRFNRTDENRPGEPRPNPFGHIIVLSTVDIRISTVEIPMCTLVGVFLDSVGHSTRKMQLSWALFAHTPVTILVSTFLESSWAKCRFLYSEEGFLKNFSRQSHKSDGDKEDRNRWLEAKLFSV